MTTIEPGAATAAAGPARDRAIGPAAGLTGRPAAESTAGAAPARPLRIGLVSISDRASTGVYEDKGIPSLIEWLGSALKSPWEQETRLIPDEIVRISATLVELIDEARCDLVLTTGGTGPSRRDVTPEATLAIASKEMPGFGEQMRQISLRFVPTAILSRQVAAIREIDGHAALIVNLPGQPKSIRETLEGLRDPDGALVVAGIFAAIPYCIDLIGGPYAETHEPVVKAFRPRKK
jgi:molybdopterin adenylyltransferase